MEENLCFFCSLGGEICQVIQDTVKIIGIERKVIEICFQIEMNYKYY